jgi:hypothetical protein
MVEFQFLLRRVSKAALKGLSHEIDFKNVDPTLKNLMPVCVGLIMVSSLFLLVPPITSGV